MRRDLYMTEGTFSRLPDKMQALSAVLESLLGTLDRFDPRSA
jgi:hypothetical protein